MTSNDTRPVKRRKMCVCGKAQPNFAHSGAAASDAKHCAQCKEAAMINVTRRRCVCGKAIPVFAHPGAAASDARHCAQCKEAGMINVKNAQSEHLAHQWETKHDRPFAKTRFSGTYLCGNCLLHALGASGGTMCRAVRREHIALGHLMT